MRIYTAQEMQNLDRLTFDRLGLPSSAIMETAGRQVVEVLLDRYADEVAGSVVVLCGPGNNGGDGFVVARVLLDLGYDVSVMALRPIDQLKGDALIMAKAWKEVGGEELVLSDSEDLSNEAEALLFGATLIVDALFGTGFSGSPRGNAAQLIEFVGGLGVPTLSIDIPSGVNATDGTVEGCCFQAWTTVAIQSLKIGHVLFPGAEFAGSVLKVDVGIREDYQSKDWPRRELLDLNMVNDLIQCYLPGAADGHKGTRGHVLVVGGAHGHVGAAKLAGQSALRCGAGLTTLGVPEDVHQFLSPALDELMCAALSPDAKIVESLCSNKDALVVGPGLGQSCEAADTLAAVLAEASKHETPLVLDADALNILASLEKGSVDIPQNAVMTPHPGEAARLLGVTVEEIQTDRINAAQSLVEKFGCVVVLKGARTLIAHPSNVVFVSPIADEALGTAGSGDVLSGVLGALLARSIPSLEAAIIGVFVHGIAGEYLSVFKGYGSSFLASELAKTCGNLLQCLSVYEVSVAGRRDTILPSWIPHVVEFEDLADCL